MKFWSIRRALNDSPVDGVEYKLRSRAIMMMEFTEARYGEALKLVQFIEVKPQSLRCKAEKRIKSSGQQDFPLQKNTKRRNKS